MDILTRGIADTTSRDRTDLAIVGGGLNGMVLALATAGSGLSVTLIDAQKPAPHDTPDDTPHDAPDDDGKRAADFDGRSYALALATTRMLRALGLWQVVQEDSQPILKITASDGRAGEGPSPLSLHFDHAEIEEGPMGHMIEDRHQRPALLRAVAGCKGITHLTGRQVVDQAVDAAGVEITLADGEVLRARLLIGSDGRNSGTARRAGIRRTGWTYGQTALVCAIAHERDHAATAHQFFMPQGPLAVLPLRGNRSSIVWTESAGRAERINALTQENYLAVLRPRFGDFLGRIDLAGQRFSYPLGLSLANAMVADRLALVGDAAHAVHPLAGQGLNQGLRDVAALSEVLIDAHRRGEDFASPLTLARYQQWRRFDATTLALATDGFNRLFSNDNPLLRGLRDLGLGAVNALPGLRRGFIREAAGLTGELPRLMQGRAL
ncbi:UbiH/UbiF/VisC/COQ6 family ubiquinone biosynthesis hydroxylase [Brevirhabdus sp.]|uniref:UbiH/UbiF/VisC/COQ6 family ubiquinone biosynthesis hydroxylase n=1 Tax=Brevirhabdus sp. TaxID=2004514 RepID=UPI00405869E6